MVSNENKDLLLVAERLVEKEDLVWFPLLGYTGLIRASLKDADKMKYYSIPGVQLLLHDAYTDIKKVDDKIVLIPHSCDIIALFDIKKENFFTTKISFGKSFNRNAVMASGFHKDKCVYMLGWSFPGIVRFDTEKLIMDCIDNWLTDNRIPQGDTRGYFGKGIVWEGENSVLLPLACVGGLLKLDTNTLETEFIDLRRYSNGIGAICSYSDGICFANNSEDNRTIFFLDKNYQISSKVIVQDKNEGFHGRYNDLVVMGDYLFAFPRNKGKVGIVDIKKQLVVYDDELETMFLNDKESCKSGIKYGGVMCDGSKLMFITGYDSAWHTYDVRTHDHEVTYCKYPNFDGAKILDGIGKANRDKGILLDESLFTLDNYIEWLEK